MYDGNFLSTHCRSCPNFILSIYDLSGHILASTVLSDELSCPVPLRSDALTLRSAIQIGPQAINLGHCRSGDEMSTNGIKMTHSGSQGIQRRVRCGLKLFGQPLKLARHLCRAVTRSCM